MRLYYVVRKNNIKYNIMHSGHNNNNNSTMVGISGTSRPLTTSCTLPICFPRQTSGKTVRSLGWYRPESTQSFPRCWTRCSLRGTTTEQANTWHRQWLSPPDPNAFRLWTHKMRISIINKHNDQWFSKWFIMVSNIIG